MIGMIGINACGAEERNNGTSKHLACQSSGVSNHPQLIFKVRIGTKMEMSA
jgi:hypothetical protein